MQPALSGLPPIFFQKDGRLTAAGIYRAHRTLAYRGWTDDKIIACAALYGFTYTKHHSPVYGHQAVWRCHFEGSHGNLYTTQASATINSVQQYRIWLRAGKWRNA